MSSVSESSHEVGSRPHRNLCGLQRAGLGDARFCAYASSGCGARQWPPKAAGVRADNSGMYMTNSMFTTVATIVAGLLLTLYIMRRRVRKGTRIAKF